MTDIVSVGNDIGLFDTAVPKAGNILSVQLGALTYAPELGIDLKYFLSDQFEFQNESFLSHLIQTLANSSINVTSVMTTVEELYHAYTFNVTAAESDSALIAR